jgi:CRISPR system Cascade subunit CasD
MRLCGPMQAWGTQSRFTMRDTGLEPSKSGVIGLICAAFGRSRSEPVDDLAALRMGVRVDREGLMKREYQTALNVVKADGSGKGTVTSNRYYLADADFLVGLEARDIAGGELLRRVNAKLRKPRWQLFLGRKACPTCTPVYLPHEEGIVENRTLLETLIAYPWPRAGAPLPPERKRPDRLRFVMETTYGAGPETQYDQPEGAAFSTRRFIPRSVKTIFRDLGHEIPIRKETPHVSLPPDS